MNQDVLTARGVAGRLGCSTWLIYDLVRKGELSGFRVGSLLRFRPADVEDYVRRTSFRKEPPAPRGRRRSTPVKQPAAYRKLV